MKAVIAGAALVLGLTACDFAESGNRAVEGRVIKIGEWPHACTFEKRVEVLFEYPGKNGWSRKTVCLTRAESADLKINGPIKVQFP